MIIISSLIISFFVVCLIHAHRKKADSGSAEKYMLSLIHQLELLYKMQPVIEVDNEDVYRKIGERVKRCIEIVNKYENINLQLLAYKMKSIYDSFKVKGV